MHHADLHAETAQAISCFQAEQAATNYNGIAAATGELLHLVGVFEGAKAQHIAKVIAGNRQHGGARTGGDDQMIPVDAHTAFGQHILFFVINTGSGIAAEQSDAVLLIPVARMGDQFVA